MTGMRTDNGHAVTGLAHIQQSIRDILTTPIGARVMRREYGSLLPELIDQPLNDVTLLQAYSATIMAITRWEPRVRVLRVNRQVDTAQHGRALLGIDAQTHDGQRLHVEVPFS
ncbi:GPW/gp25 family protein [Vreelandella sp. TE19]